MTVADMFILLVLGLGIWWGLAVIGYQLTRIANAMHYHRGSPTKEAGE